jgi:hypothetical protein
MDGTTSTSDGVDDDGVPTPPMAKVAIRRNSFLLGTKKNNKPNERHEENNFSTKRSSPQVTFVSSAEAVVVSRTRATSSEVHGRLLTSDDKNAMPFFGSLTLAIADLVDYYYIIASFRKTALQK